MQEGRFTSPCGRGRNSRQRIPGEGPKLEMKGPSSGAEFILGPAFGRTRGRHLLPQGEGKRGRPSFCPFASPGSFRTRRKGCLFSGASVWFFGSLRGAQPEKAPFYAAD
jgi:hypothetical protein